MLTGKIKRDYREYDRVWTVEELRSGFDCLVGDDCTAAGAVFEIRRPRISEAERIPPVRPFVLTGWLKEEASGRNPFPGRLERMAVQEEGGVMRYTKFDEDADRVRAYDRWRREWEAWSENLRSKETALALYEEFFNLLTRFENEGENLELVLGEGLLLWNHPDPSVGLIRTPVMSSKLELAFDAVNGVIAAKSVEDLFVFEQEPFMGVTFPHSRQAEELIASIPEIGLDEPYEIRQFLKEFVHLIDANGRYSEAAEPGRATSVPVVYPGEMFLLRSKQSRVIRDDLTQIISGVRSGSVELSPAVLSLIGGEVPVQADPGTRTDDILYFPLPSNEQQKDIVERIRGNFGVTIQGPPGTGKTHTIANLVSHFLSEGKKVLITSQKESPLRVLKDKIPEDIRDLCVPVLGGGRESLQDIEASTRLISEKLGELDPRQLRRYVERDRDELMSSREREERLLGRLQGYAEAEGTPVIYRGRKLTKVETAKRLASSEIDAGWIADPVAFEEEFPLGGEEFEELWSLKNRIGGEWFKLAGQRLPDLQDDVISFERLKWLLNDRRVLERDQEEAKRVIEANGWPDDLASLQEFEEAVLQAAGNLQSVDLDRFRVLISDLRAGGVREQRWLDWMAKIEEMNAVLASLYADLANHRLAPPPFPVSEVRQHLDVLADELKSGGEPGFLFWLGKGRKAKYLYQHDWLDGHPVRSAADIDVFRKFVDYQELRNTLRRIYNSPSGESGLPEIEADARRFPYEMDEHIALFKKVHALVREIELLKASPLAGRLDREKFYDAAWLEGELLPAVRLAKRVPEYGDWQDSLRSLVDGLKEKNDGEDVHPIAGRLIDAVGALDEERFYGLVAELKELVSRRDEALKLQELLRQLSESMPKTAGRLEGRLGVEDAFPEDYLDAFEWKKLKTWVDESKGMDTTVVRGQIAGEQAEQARLINQIVKNATWANLLENITEREKNALSAWKSSIKRYGKGTGRHARYYLKTARENMKVAQTAIPVWIMPINQVLENFPAANEKFDVIIFDESSQCDIFSTNVLLRGKKAIVVGDEEQISPQAIGIRFDDVRELSRRYLKGVPNAALLDGNTSLYELAEQTFPKGGKLMLREHFRSVKEIIEFSNRLSYDGEMVPMRVPLENEKFDRPVVAVKVADGRNDELDKDVNVPEADRIVEDIVRMIRDPRYDNQTFGVISLQGQKQHRLLETKIRNAIGDDEFVRRRMICGSPYTLQGDERDIIFLSMVVAPGRRFRALTGSADKQRFNVAASRAKNQMRLYHSVDPEDLSIDDLRYRLLSYCRQTEIEHERVPDPEGLCESEFERDVLRVIRERGYAVKPKVRVGKFLIDFVIEGAKDRLAVECEGDKWQGPERFLSDLYRRQSLERVGWEFWQIRGSDFYFDQETAMQPLWQKLEERGIERESE